MRRRHAKALAATGIAFAVLVVVVTASALTGGSDDNGDSDEISSRQASSTTTSDTTNCSSLNGTLTNTSGTTTTVQLTFGSDGGTCTGSVNYREGTLSYQWKRTPSGGPGNGTTDCSRHGRIENGQTVTIPAGFIIDGDVSVNGTVLHDTDANTALRVNINQQAEVFAKDGASYYPRGCEPAAKPNTVVKNWPEGSTPPSTTTTTSSTTTSTTGSTTTGSTTTTATPTTTSTTAPSTTSTSAPTTTTSSPQATTTTVASTTTTNPVTTTTSPQNNACPPTSLPANQSVRLKAGCTIAGDVIVDGIPQYDNLEAVGLIVVLTRDAEVVAPWGASADSRSSDAVRTEMTTVRGCKTVCTDVVVKTI